MFLWLITDLDQSLLNDYKKHLSTEVNKYLYKINSGIKTYKKWWQRKSGGHWCKRQMPILIVYIYLYYFLIILGVQKEEHSLGDVTDLRNTSSYVTLLMLFPCIK